MNKQVFELAEQLWLYLRLDQTFARSDCIVGLGSYDLRVAERCADLYMVSKPSTERRMFATCQRLWPEMPVAFSSPQISLAEQLRGGIGEGLIHEMVGDIQRIKEYPARGFQIPQEIPDRVHQAYETLIELGFDKHLIA